MSVFPYRWTLRTFGPNLRYLYLDVIYGVWNLWHWFPIVWADRDYDSAYLLAAMEFKFKHMARCLGRGCHRGRERNARDCRVAAALCNRMRNEPYYDMHGSTHDRTWALRISASEAGDKDYLARLIQRRLYKWWD